MTNPLHPAALLRWRNYTLTLALLLTAALLTGLPHLTYDTRIDTLLGVADPYIRDRDLMALQFEDTATISISVRSTPETSLSVFDPVILNALGELHFLYRQIPYTDRGSSVVAYDSPFGEIPLIPGRFRNFEGVPDDRLQAARQRAMNDPFIRGNLISEDEKLARFVASLTLNNSNSAQNQEISAALLEVLATLRASYPELEFAASAEALFDSESRQAMLADLTRLLPLVIFACILLICLFFRSVMQGAVLLPVTGITVASTVGLQGWTGMPFNSISVMAPLVVVIIVVANSAHILSLYRQQLLTADTPDTAMLLSLQKNVRPVTLASLTTAIGFASLNYASSPAISAFGSVVATGVLFAWLYSLFALPALLMFLKAPTQPLSKLAPGFLDLCRALRERSPRLLLYGTLLVSILCAWLMSLNRIDFNRLDFINTDSTLRDYVDQVSSHMERANTLTYGLQFTNQTATDPVVLTVVDNFSLALQQWPQITSVVSLTDVVKTINETLGDGYQLPETADEVELHLMNYLSVQRPGYTLNQFVSEDYRLMRLMISTVSLSNHQLVQLDQQIAELAEDFLPDHGVKLLHSSDLILFARMDDTVTRELIISYLISLLTITATLMTGLRSVYFGLVSVLPNVLPAVLVFGAWGLLIGTLDPFVMMLFSISIGLVIDDTVHVISAYQRELSAAQATRTYNDSAFGPEFSEGSNDVINRAVQTAGPALIITTAVLALGTFLLIFAETLYFQQAAQLLVPIVVIALVLDLTFLPLLLSRLELLRARWRGIRQ